MNRFAGQPLSATVFAVLGAGSLVAGVVLGMLGSFALPVALSVGLFFISASLIARAIRSPALRAAAVLWVGGLALLVFGMTATPLFYAGWGVLAGAAVLAVILGRSVRHP